MIMYYDESVSEDADVDLCIDQMHEDKEMLCARDKYSQTMTNRMTLSQ